MFWKVLSGLTRTTLALHKSVTAVGLTIMIGVGVYDYLKSRNQRERRQLPSRR